jgi:hypothetical protein
MDDIIVHASNQIEHDTCLENAVRVLRYKCITLNGGVCQLNMSQVVLMGHVLSDRGVGPAEVKVKAVVEACAPRPTGLASAITFVGAFLS